MRVFQDFQLFSTDRNVHDNLKFALRATGWQDPQGNGEAGKINDVLEKVGLGTKGFKMPYELSGGEQQRVDIARAMLNSPKPILADEPTGDLDPETSDGIMRLLLRICRRNRHSDGHTRLHSITEIPVESTAYSKTGM